MPEITERMCGNCGQRCRRGWLRVHEQGDARAPGANKGPQHETVYCSEKCLRTQLFHAAGNTQLIVEQQREIDRLKSALRNRRQHEQWTEDQQRGAENVLRAIATQAEIIAGVANGRAVQPGSEEAERFGVAAHNILKILGSHPARPCQD
ncbi:hypothetical protein [Streptomyces sp. NPDC006645]|uniref:hypothetical protein n=1 Tax=unclassified Streptomyces TaxID=2593676 RepID=UPI0033B9056A